MKSCHNRSSIISWVCFDSTRSSKWRTSAWAQITYHGYSLQWTLCTLPILNSCMKDRCGFLHCCTELVSWEHAACPLSGIKKRPLVGGWVNISSVVILIGATASVCYREVVRSWEGALWEVPLYSLYSEICSCKLPLVSGPVIILQYDLCITCLCVVVCNELVDKSRHMYSYLVHTMQESSCQAFTGGCLS